MAGFNVPPGGPVPPMTPELLAQLAAAGFKPPGPMSMPGMSAPQMGGGGGDGGGLGAGMAGLGAGLGMLGKMGGGNPFMAAERTAGDRDLGGYGASPVDPMGGNPNAVPSEIFNPTGAVGGGGLGGLFGRLGLKWPPGGLF